MASLTAEPHTRSQCPRGVSTVELEADAPELLPLLKGCPMIQIYTRSSPHFHGMWLAPNCRAKAQPRAIVRPRSDAEVQYLLRFASGLAPESATGHRLPLTVRGGGHDSFGRSTIADGIVLDTRALDSIELSADKTTVRIGGGVLAGSLLDFLAPHGRFVPMGYCSTVGYTGWSLGGGYGVFTPSYGAGAQNVLGARIATADGRLVDTDDDPELFWGLRGAGNSNFGVVLELRVKVFPSPPILAGWVGFPHAEAESVLGGFGEKYEMDMPNQFNGDVIFAQVPDKGPLVMFMFVWTATDGDLSPGYTYLEKIKALGTVVLDTVEKTTPDEFLTTLNATFKDFVGSPFYIASPTLVQTNRAFGRILAANPTPMGGHIVGGTHNVHGIVETPDSTLALPNRRHVTLTLFGAVSKECEDNGPEMKVVRDWVDKFVAELYAEEGLTLRNGYVSFDRSDIDLDDFYGKESADRLRALKRKYDPDTLFVLAYPTLI